MRKTPLVLFCFLALLFSHVSAQINQTDSILVRSKKFASTIDKEARSLENKITRKTKKYLEQLKKIEHSVVEKNDQLNPADKLDFAKQIDKQYNNFSNLLESKVPLTGLTPLYIPRIDTLLTSLNFVNGLDTKNLDVTQTKLIKEGSESLTKLKEKLEISRDVQAFVEQRRQLLEQKCQSGLKYIKEYKAFAQTAVYYKNQIQEYRNIIDEPEKLVDATISILNRVPAFQEFMQKNSMLARLFPSPSQEEAELSLHNLQSRKEVQASMKLQLPQESSADPAKYFQQQVQSAAVEISKIRTQLEGQLNGIGSAGSDDLNAIKIDQQKTKSLFQRLEFGFNIQTQRATNYFPVTSDISVTAGYKVKDNLVVGVGIAGSMGWGNGWKNVEVSGQGLGLRSFAEWLIPPIVKSNKNAGGNFWLTAGAEFNYQKIITSISDIKNFNSWSRSALIGITKKYSIPSPFRKGKRIEGKIQLLYDALYARHRPVSSPVLWRFGYSF